MREILFVGPYTGRFVVASQNGILSGFIETREGGWPHIHGQRFLGSAEPFVWAAVYAAVDALMIAGHNVVVDATHMTKKRRQPWTDRGAEFLLIGATKEECIDRALALDDREIVPIIERMAAECDWPAAIGLDGRPAEGVV